MKKNISKFVILCFVFCFQDSLHSQTMGDSTNIIPCTENSYDDFGYMRELGFGTARDGEAAMIVAKNKARDVLYARVMEKFFPEIIQCIDSQFDLTCVHVDQQFENDSTYGATIVLEASKESLSRAIDSVVIKKAHLREPNFQFIKQCAPLQNQRNNR